MTQEEKQKTFNTTFQERGGLFRADILNEGSRNVFEYYKKRSVSYINSCRNFKDLLKPLPEIYFDYIDNPKIGAVSDISKDGTYILGLNSGTIFLLSDLFFRMLANPFVLPSIGNSSLETKESPSLRNYYLDADLLVSYGDFDYNNYEASIPKDKTRQVYARYLVDTAIDFFIAHESSHILNGHLDFKKNLNKAELDEMSLRYKYEDKILTEQTIEMDADSMAVSKGLANAVRVYLGEKNIHKDRKQFYGSLKDVIFNWSVSVLTLTRIMTESTVFRDFDSSIHTHPHPRVRQSMILTTVHEYFQKYYPDIYKSIPVDIFGDILVTIETTYKFITGNTIDKKEYLKELDNGAEYIRKVLEHWKVMRPDLSRYSYVELIQ